MKFIRPVTITDAMLISSSISEPDVAVDPAVWNSGTSYTVGQRATRTGVHGVYEALTANSNKTPESNPTDWIMATATNKWAPFDQKVGTVMVGASGTTFTLAPGIVDSIYLGDVSASEAVVTMVDGAGGPTVFSRTVSLEAGNPVVDAYAYCFEPIVRRSAIVLTDLPPYANGRITVTLNDGASTVSLGTCVVGRQFHIGETQRPARIGAIDFSVREADKFGTLSFSERPVSRKPEVQVIVPSVMVDEIQRQVLAMRAKPAVWIGDPDYDSLLIYGICRDFSIDLRFKNGISYVSMTLESLSSST